MNKFILLLTSFFVSSTVLAACPQAESMYLKNVNASIPLFQNCAVLENDEDSQIRLAGIFKNGEKNAQKNDMKALLFYHLAADNGNAYAQTQLAKMLIEMDQDAEKRKVLVAYLKQIKSALQTDENYAFKGEILHPFLLLILASEPAEQKWYYPTNRKYSSEAAALLKGYNVSEEKKKELLKSASLWKQRKMMETAKEVLSESEYQTFERTLFPKQGKADPFLRKQIINNLKTKVENYLK